MWTEHDRQQERDRRLIIDESVDGMRVRCIDMSFDEEYPVDGGVQGTARFWNNYAQTSTLAVHWDNGRQLSLVEGVDRWEWKLDPQDY